MNLAKFVEMLPQEAFDQLQEAVEKRRHAELYGDSPTWEEMEVWKTQRLIAIRMYRDRRGGSLADIKLMFEIANKGASHA